MLETNYYGRTKAGRYVHVKDWKYVTNSGTSREYALCEVYVNDKGSWELSRELEEIPREDLVEVSFEDLQQALSGV